ncbi:MAG: hypothetical protein PUE95_00880 [Lachnospiraceae bacterium]|nr:hypothetical protein [Lachnospiraceae bacterium]
MKILKEIIIDDNYLVRDKSSSDGAQDKFYKEGIWYKSDYYGGEAEAEYLSSLLLSCTNLEKKAYVLYEKCKLNQSKGCFSTDFLDASQKEEFVTFYRLYFNIYGKDLAAVTSRMDYDDAIEYVIKFVKEVTDLDIRCYLANTFYLDRIILNTDRHFNNMGIIFDGENYREAPIFDNGKSLFVGESYEEDMSDSEIQAKIRKLYAKAFSPSFQMNYNYLKEDTDIALNLELLKEKLKEVPESFQKRILIIQLSKIFA